MGVVALGEPFAAAPFFLLISTIVDMDKLKFHRLLRADPFFRRWLDDPDFRNLRPIAGGQNEGGDDEHPEFPVPEKIVTNAFATVWSEDTSTYADWVLSAYRPMCHAAAINFAAAGIATIYSAPPNELLQIANIFIVVDAETDITLYGDGVARTGPMSLGADGEPRGLVIPFAYAPWTVGFGGVFSIGSSDAVQVSGMVTYMLV